MWDGCEVRQAPALAQSRASMFVFGTTTSHCVLCGLLPLPPPGIQNTIQMLNRTNEDHLEHLALPTLQEGSST